MLQGRGAAKLPAPFALDVSLAPTCLISHSVPLPLYPTQRVSGSPILTLATH